MPKQRLHHIDVASLVIQSLCKRLPHGMRRYVSVQPRLDESCLKYLVRGLTVQHHSARVMAR